jgi:hypothetical protein
MIRFVVVYTRLYLLFYRLELLAESSFAEKSNGKPKKSSAFVSKPRKL